jgi:replication-associated recombination protein RarA
MNKNSASSLEDPGKECKQVKLIGTNGVQRGLGMPQTPRGYDLFELLSALQKDVRRGKECQAVFWAVELESFSQETLWNRLSVIASEDIGIADPLAPLVIDVLEKEYNDAKRRGNDSHRLFLVNAVLFLARSPKSRIVDDLLITVYGDIKFRDKRLEIPDYALDMHTLRGAKNGRGIKDFLEEGSKLENETIQNPYRESAREILLKYGKP